MEERALVFTGETLEWYINDNSASIGTGARGPLVSNLPRLFKPVIRALWVNIAEDYSTHHHLLFNAESPPQAKRDKLPSFGRGRIVLRSA